MVKKKKVDSQLKQFFKVFFKNKFKEIGWIGVIVICIASIVGILFGAGSLWEWNKVIYSIIIVVVVFIGANIYIAYEEVYRYGIDADEIAATLIVSLAVIGLLVLVPWMSYNTDDMDQEIVHNQSVDNNKNIKTEIVLEYNELNFSTAVKYIGNDKLWDKYCKSLGAEYGYFSAGPRGTYGSCNYGKNSWKKFSSQDYIKFLEQEFGETK